MVSFFESSPAMPGALHALGYELLQYDAPVTLLEPDGAGSLVPSQPIAPDAICYQRQGRRMLVLECKSGSIRFDQLPEGRSASKEAWLTATRADDPTVDAQVAGVLMGPAARMLAARAAIDVRGISAIGVSRSGVELDPNHQSDPDLRSALVRTKVTPWPSTYVPFSGNPAEPDAAQRVLAAIGPVVLEFAAHSTDEFVVGDVVMRTHEAVWDVSPADRQRAWCNRAAEAFEWLSAKASFRHLWTYDKEARRVRLHMDSSLISRNATVQAIHIAFARIHRPPRLKKSTKFKAANLSGQMTFRWTDRS